jgi:hypothetical protein
LIKSDIFESQQNASIQIFTNLNAFKMITKSNNGEFTQNLHTIPFKTIKNNFSKEFGQFLKTIYNYNEWYSLKINNKGVHS